MSTRRALVTGLSGQDGSYLAELLLGNGYQVWGLVRDDRLGCSQHLRERVELVHGDLLDPSSLTVAVAGAQPDEIYHLAAPSFVPDSWARPARTFAAIAGATATLLEAVREQAPKTRVFVASSATMFGDPAESPQCERTRFRPQSPYATAKLAAHELAGQLRAHDDLFVCCGILYNHESERRPEQFVTRKVSKTAAAINLGLADRLSLGDLDAVRDWSFAGDVVHGAWLSLQADEPGDYVLASGEPHTVAELAATAFGHVGLDWREYVDTDTSLVRTPERMPLVGDPTRARELLGWKPTVAFKQLIERMVDADLRTLKSPTAPRCAR